MAREHNRRGLIKALLAGTFAAVVRPARAQSLDDIFTRILNYQSAGTDPLRALLSSIPINLGEIISAITMMERDADARSIPPSPLTPSASQGAPITIESLYQAAMPRLVALIDRAERIDPAIAEQAGGLLAKVHSTQHVLPARFAALAEPGAGQTNGWLGIDAASGQAALPRLDMGGGANSPPPGEQADPAGEAAPATTTMPLSRSRSYENLREEYLRLFETAAVRPDRSDAAQWHLRLLRQARSRYDDVAAKTGIPWFFVGVIHGLEASFNFRGHIHNGDFPLSSRTKKVPQGRPVVWLPPADWVSSAVDAMRLMGFAGQDDWSLARTLYRLEAYNGFGYRGRGVATPYLWSFSGHYERGKFVADGRWSTRAQSQQCGAAIMLRLLVDAREISFSA